jgi:hypothetical protein
MRRMPKVQTKSMQAKSWQKPHPIPAAGLHDPDTAKTHFFRDFRFEDTSEAHLVIGRSPKCHIRLRDERVSNGHAVLERTKQGYKISDHGSTNGVYIDGRRADEPVVVTVGMRIYLGPAVLVGVDENGRAPLDGVIVTQSDFCRGLVRLYGSPTVAAERLGGKPSREFIRAKSLPKRLRP